MTIRVRLSIVSMIVAALMLLMVVFLLTIFMQNRKQVAQTRSNVEHFYEVSRIRAGHNGQIQEMMAYLLTGDNIHRLLYFTHAEEADEVLHLWSAEEEKENLAAVDIAQAAEVVADHRELARLVSVVMGASRDDNKGNRNCSYVQRQVAPFVHGKLFGTLDESFSAEVSEVTTAFVLLVNRTAAVPWSREEPLLEMEEALEAISYYCAVDSSYMAVRREIIAAVAYVISGHEDERKRFERYSAEAATGFRAYERAINRSQQDGPSKAYDIQLFHEIREICEDIENDLSHAVRLREKGRKDEAFSFLAKCLSSPMYEHFDGAMEWVLAEAKNEINRILGHIHNLTVTKTAAGMVIVIIIASCITIFTFRITKGMIGAINRLKMGVENIAGGNLGYRIEVVGHDELAVLAASFNSMTEQLERSQKELIVAKEHADRTAEHVALINDDLRNFTFIFFHDLRAPIVNIKGFVGELRVALKEVNDIIVKSFSLAGDAGDKLARLLHKEIPESFVFIENSVHKMNRLMASVTHLSHLGQRELKYEAVDMEELVQKNLKRLDEQILLHRVQVNIGSMPPVSADRYCLEIIMGHLLENAVKYLDTERDGQISISGRNAGQEVIYRIRDNGRGISLADREKMFDIFRRGGNQDIPGEGMGLAYVKTLVRRHGGRIWCESEVGVGSTFNVAFPLFPATEVI